jgi:transcription elongation factor SPT6
VKEKPVRDLNGDQFLKLHMAEQERLVTIKISEDLEGMTSSSYLEEIKQLYNKDEFSKSVQAWNNLRMESVDLAMRKLLIPSLTTELRERLLAEAKEHVLRACCRKLYQQLKVAPFAASFPDEDEDDWDVSKGLTVLSIAYVPDFTQAAFACVMGPEGDINEYLRLPHLMKRKNGWREEDKLQKVIIISCNDFINFYSSIP